MKKLLVWVCCCLGFAAVYSQSENKEIAIIPVPVSITQSAGELVLSKEISVEVSPKAELRPVINLLNDRLAGTAGLKMSSTTSGADATISLIINQAANTTIGMEGYQLSVTPKQIVIKANTPAGLFYGVQSLLQLLPKEIEADSAGATAAIKITEWKVPCVEITDYPRFAWRGLMFDVARHFFTKQEVKKYIDEMVRYKFNLLHLHLTDDEGWRLEIKGLPKLTEVGAWNVKKEGYFGTFTPPAANEPRNYGGFYTQDDIRELVQYAKERFVNILPEIDVPGHSLAAVASYPELSCTTGADKYVVRSGEKIMDWSHGAPPRGYIDNTLCPANEKVYVFLDTVISQMARLFPFEYIHLGGDECPKNFWEKNDQIKALAKKEGLKNMEEVQSYFEKRVEKIVESKGKKFMGWDEILEGGLAPNAVVMSWRGIKGGMEAAKMGHEVVMSPTTFVYLDYMQADPIIEPNVYATLRLSKAYEFEPVPEGVDAKYIKGGQANLWTEQLPTMRAVEYMTWPRAWAVAESVWSPKKNKNWDDFFRRTEKHFERFDQAEIKYSRGVYDPIFTASKGVDSTIKIKLATEVKGLDIYYSFDNTFPDRFYPKYTQELIPPSDAVMLKVITYKGKDPVGRMTAMPIKELKSRAKKRENYP
ncbi:MAG: family 20 glycosylhydrolase [Flavitalea sp.]